jgi:SAM-dependent methyltransferase
VKRTARLALRNLDLLLDALRGLVPPAPSGLPRPRVLEVGSGTGEQLVAFARALPHADFQPSDPDPEARASITAWAAEAQLPNLAPPLDLDLLRPAWLRQACDVLLCVNVLHVAPPAAGDALVEGAGALPPAGALLLYGPFWRGSERPPRLVRFHGELTAHDPSLGVRPLAPLLAAAAARGLAPALTRPGVEEGDVLLVLRPAAPPGIAAPVAGR